MSNFKKGFLRMKKIFFATFIFVSMSALAQDKEVLATVGSKKITVEEFNKKYNEVKSQAYYSIPDKKTFLEDLVRYELGLQEAEKRNLEKDPIVQDRFKQEMYKVLLEKELGQKVNAIKISEKEMQDYYKQNPEIRSSHILIQYKVDSTPAQIAEAKKRASEIFEEVKKSQRPFEELVKLYSDDPLSKQAGGDVGWQSRVTVVPNYYNVILNMKIGEIKGLIETQYGFHIIKVTGRRTYENADKKQVKAAVFDEKRKDLFNKYFDELKKKYAIKTNPKLLQ